MIPTSDYVEPYRSCHSPCFSRCSCSVNWNPEACDPNGADLSRSANYSVNFVVNYIDPNYTMNLVVNYFDAVGLAAVVSVNDKVHEVVKTSE